MIKNLVFGTILLRRTARNVSLLQAAFEFDTMTKYVVHGNNLFGLLLESITKFK